MTVNSGHSTRRYLLSYGRGPSIEGPGHYGGFVARRGKSVSRDVGSMKSLGDRRAHGAPRRVRVGTRREAMRARTQRGPQFVTSRWLASLRTELSVRMLQPSTPAGAFASTNARHAGRGPQLGGVLPAQRRRVHDVVAKYVAVNNPVLRQGLEAAWTVRVVHGARNELNVIAQRNPPTAIVPRREESA
jgi:hypothetical protein